MEIDSPDSKSLVSEGSQNPVIGGIARLPISRQIGVMIGLALSVALGVAIVLWSRTPDYSLLYASVADKDAGQIVEALEKLDIDYKIETGSGAIMVPTDSVHSARLKLASQGLPKSASVGFELLDKEPGFGTSQALEAVRFQRALEGEIARSVMAIQTVKSARVHLALPKQSVFVRQRKPPSASVLVNLYPGRSLEAGQVEAIVHLVASSVPMLDAEQVTVVDQRGRLLNAKNDASAIYLTSKQFEYKKQVEDHLMARVENILIPLLGSEGFRTQVTADIDFTVTEKTQERFNPDLPALRSEQTTEEQSRLAGAQGIPGALSNQPPAAGIAPETAGSAASESRTSPLNTSKTATRNFELDKTISHSRFASGELRRVTIAVVIDDQRVVAGDGSLITKEYSQEALNRFTDLVKQAVGFDVTRGDQVTVSNVSFRLPEPLEPMPELPLWEQTWFESLIKQIAAVAAVLLLIFAVLRPTMKSLIGRSEGNMAGTDAGDAEDEKDGSVSKDGLQEDRLSLSNDDDLLLLEAPKSYEKRLEFAQKMVDEDPKRVAQVIKSWVISDG